MTILHFLGTGSAMAVGRYNTCFYVSTSSCNVLIDCGGGHEILTQLSQNNIALKNTDAIFITHKHIDHTGGFLFLLRKLIEEDKKMKILCSKSMKEFLLFLITQDIPKYYSASNSLLEFQDIDVDSVFCNFSFFPVSDTNHGFLLHEEKKIAYTSDIPANEHTKRLINKCDILIHEAFCSEKEFVNNKGNHGSVEDTIKIFKEVQAKKLFIVHTLNTIVSITSPEIHAVQDGEVIILQ